MTYHIRPAIGTNAKPILGLYGLPGSGKTKTSLMLAKGFIGDMSKVVMIDTERGRGEAYAKDPEVGGYQVCPIVDSFSPKAYGEAIQAAEKFGAKVLIIDSASHEWEGIGGVLAMAAANEEKGWKGQVVWTRPKMEHQREFVGRLLQSSFDLVILNCRAKHVMIEYKDDNGKKQMKRDDVPTPIQSDQFMGEVFAYGWLDEKHNYHAVRYTNDSLIPVLTNGKPLTIETGALLARWDNERGIDKPTAPLPASEDVGFISADQVTYIGDLVQNHPDIRAKVVKRFGAVAKVPADKYQELVDWIQSQTGDL